MRFNDLRHLGKPDPMTMTPRARVVALIATRPRRPSGSADAAMSVDEVCEAFSNRGLDEHVPALREHGVDGAALLECVKADVMRDGVSEWHLVLLTASALLADMRSWSEDMLDDVGAAAIARSEQRREGARARADQRLRAVAERGPKAGFSARVSIPPPTFIDLAAAPVSRGA